MRNVLSRLPKSGGSDNEYHISIDSSFSCVLDAHITRGIVAPVLECKSIRPVRPFDLWLHVTVCLPVQSMYASFPVKQSLWLWVYCADRVLYHKLVLGQGKDTGMHASG
jgi:hypothetical protein